MFCPNCGFQNDDADVFCRQCGTKLSEDQPSAANTAENPQPEYQPVYQPEVNASAPRSSHPVLNVVKNLGASPLYLTAIIAFSTGLFLSIISLFGMRNSNLGRIDDYFAQFGINDFDNIGGFDSVLNSFYSYLSTIGFIVLIPTILCAVGMWITYAGAVNSNSDGMSVSGLKIIKVIQIIDLVFRCVLFAVTEIACVVVIAAAPSITDDYDVFPVALGISVVFGVLAVVILVVAVLSIIYRAKIISSVNAVTKTIVTGNPNYKVSGFVAVMNFIIAACSVLTLFSGGFISALLGICDITALVCFALLIFKYNDTMRSISFAASLN